MILANDMYRFSLQRTHRYTDRNNVFVAEYAKVPEHVMLDDTPPPSPAADDPRPEAIDSDDEPLRRPARYYGLEDAGSEYDDVEIHQIDQVLSKRRERLRASNAESKKRKSREQEQEQDEDEDEDEDEMEMDWDGDDDDSPPAKKVKGPAPKKKTSAVKKTPAAKKAPVAQKTAPEKENVAPGTQRSMRKRPSAGPKYDFGDDMMDF
jgi:hypothetical protein